MALAATSQIDALGIHDETGDLDVILIDERDWLDESAHLELLQAKLNSYLRFLESGEVFETRPEAVGRPIRIRIHFKEQPTTRAGHFLKKAARAIAEAGFDLSYRVHPSEAWLKPDEAAGQSGI